MNILHTDKEQRLLRLFDRGDATAMDKLYAEYADYLTGVAYRYIGNDDDVKDVLQEAFIKIFTHIGEFKYKGKGSLKAWLTRITINECLMFLRKASPVDSEGGEYIERLADEPDSSAEQFSISSPSEGVGDEGTISPPLEGLGEALFDMIASLPPGYREVFNLFVIEGLSHKQIAEQLGITPSTSASQFHKARKMLARMINDYRKENEYGEGMD